MKGKATEWIMGTVFALVGFAVLVGGSIYCASVFKAKSNAVQQTAIISDMVSYRDSDGDTSYHVYVNYTVDGQEYDQKLNFYSSNMRVGKEITIFYNPDSPNKIVAGGGSEYFILMIPSMGAIFFIVGFAILMSKIKKISNKKKMLETGERIEADIDEIVINHSYSVNGRHPYIISCRWTEARSGMTYLFKSENIWYNPEPSIRSQGITSFPVYVDRDNLKKYYVVLDKLSYEMPYEVSDYSIRR